MKDERLVWRYCIAANIKRSYTDDDGDTWRGTEMFPGGRKIYVSNRYCKASREIVVMGLNRFKSKYDWGWIPLDCVENIRPQRTFNPRIVELMGDWESKFIWWGPMREDQYDVEAYADMLISEQTSGQGYESYLRNRLINGLEGERLRSKVGLETEELYSKADLPLEYLYIGNEGYPSRIVKEVLLEYPEYLKQWPGLQAYLE